MTFDKIASLVLGALVLNCVLALDCPPGVSNGNCTVPSSTNNGATENPNETEEVTSIDTIVQSSTSASEESTKSGFQPTPLPSSSVSNKANSSSKSTNVEPKGRALNFTSNVYSNGVVSNISTHDEFGDLSDVSIHENEDLSEEGHHDKGNGKHGLNSTLGTCEKGGLTYENGQRLEHACESVCTCLNGKMDCEDRCTGPLFRKGKKIEDPLCIAKDSDDECCSILICANDSEPEPLEMCSYDNKNYQRGESFNKGCESVCLCEAGGKTTCKARCPTTSKTSESCVEIPDPNDPCCKKVLCDVTLDDHEREEDSSKLRILSAKYLNSSMILIKFDPKYEDHEFSPIVELSNDKKDWTAYKLLPGGYLPVQRKAKFIRLENSHDVQTLEESVDPETTKPTKDSPYCHYKGKTLKIGEEYNDNCTALCVCRDTGVHCLQMECPTYFGVDVLDPNCVKWETVPPDFVPSPPKCCPDKVQCKSYGSCLYEGVTYKNWQQIPENVTGCEKRCYCEMGKVDCQNTCAPVPAHPPQHLPCPPQMATVGHIDSDSCCMYWICKPPSSAVVNKTDPTSTTQNEDKGLPLTKEPSKVLGPLLVYQNENDNRFKNPLHTYPHPVVLPEENPFFHKSNPIIRHQITKNPSLDKPPSATSNYILENDPKRRPYKRPDAAGVHIHAKGNPEEILQFINQHPEISGYPPGSVLEIHNVNPNPNVIPYVVPSESINHHLPPGVSLGEILQEIHKQTQPQIPQNVYTYQNRPTYADNGRLTNRPGQVFPGGFPNIPSFQQPQDEISVHTLEAIDAHTVRLAFVVPPVIVGLHGRVEVRYTSTASDDLDTWEYQVFAPPHDLIATPQLEFELVNLNPDTEYRIKITITLRDLHNTHNSRIYKIRTQKEQSTTLPPMIPIEPELSITDINATWVTVAWRKFTEYELQFIDGIQLRFKEIEGKIYAATPLIHRAVRSYTLENLKPNTKYEIGIFFIPFAGQLTELHSERMLHFTTANEVDTYGFNVSLEISQIKSTSVEIVWSGVPYPEDKYVNIYRAIYQSDSGKEDHSTFKIAKRDAPTKTVIMDLKPGTRYRLWLEIYLTNGKIKTSNVQDFITKPRHGPSLGASTQQDKLQVREHPDSKGDYYGPLVIVAILAAIAILSTLVLLLILVKRHNQNKAAITPPSRISQSAYDNPTYKVEIQQETMGL